MSSNTDPRYRRTKYGTVFVGFNPRHRRRSLLRVLSLSKGRPLSCRSPRSEVSLGLVEGPVEGAAEKHHPEIIGYITEEPSSSHNSLSSSRPETYGWQPTYTHPNLKRTVYEQDGCRLAKIPGQPGWLAQNRHGVLYHYTTSLAQLTPDILADNRHLEEIFRET